jgi:hypothetical protein
MNLWRSLWWDHKGMILLEYLEEYQQRGYDVHVLLPHGERGTEGKVIGLVDIRLHCYRFKIRSSV